MVANNSYMDIIPATVDSVIDKRNETAVMNDPSIVSDDESPEDEIVVDADLNDSIEVELDEDVVHIEVDVDRTFARNMVVDIPIVVADDIAIELIDKYERDREDRKKRDDQQAEGLRKAGIDEDVAPSGADFEGSSKAVHPMIAEGCIEFAGREVKELAPPSGAVKSHIVGNATAERIEISQRKAEFLNLLLREYMPYRKVLNTMLSQLPLGGSQFIKFWHDEHLKRPQCEFLPIDKVFIPYACNDFYTADRVTVVMEVSNVEYWRRVRSGMYIDEEIEEDGGEIRGSRNLEDISKSERVSNVIDGKEKEPTNDGDNDSVELLEVYTYLQLDEDEIAQGELVPYIVTIRRDSNKIISLYRNWDEHDDRFIKLDYIVMCDFIVWRGAYGIGLGQILGSLSTAATGALRALLDSAHVNNIPSAFAFKGLKMAGQTSAIQVGQLTYLEGPSGLDGDIRKAIMPLPFNPPSPVLFNLLEWVTSAADRLVRTPNGVLDSMGDRTPASTSLAMIEQSSMTQSAIHQQLHQSQAIGFKIVCRLLAKYFDPAGYPQEVIQRLKVEKSLFSSTDDIIPVSDPNIFTGQQRFAQIQLVSALNKEYPGLLDPKQILKRTLQLAQVPDADSLMKNSENVTEANPVAENVGVSLGQPIGVFPDQDHLAHIKIHAEWLQSPLFGKNPMFQDRVAAMANHIKEHLVFAYASTYETAMETEAPHGVMDGFTQIARRVDTTSFDNQLVQQAPLVNRFLEQDLQQYQPIIQQVMQAQEAQAQAARQNNPQLAKVETEKAKLQAQQQIAQMQLQAKAEETKTQAAAQQQKGQLDLQAHALDTQAKMDMVRGELEMEKDKNSAQLEIEKMKLVLEKIKALAGIRSQDANIELQQLQLLLQEFGKADKISNNLQMHQNKLEQELYITGAQQAHEQQLRQLQAQGAAQAVRPPAPQDSATSTVGAPPSDQPPLSSI